MSTVTKKKPHHNVKVNKSAKKWWVEHRHIGSWRLKPYSKEGVRRLATRLVEWAKNSPYIYLERFWLEMGISTSSFQNLRKKSPELEEAYLFAREWMGMKREERIHNKEADRETIGWRQPVYSQEVKEVAEWRSSLREKEKEAGAGNYVIEMKTVPNSEIVPVKTKEN